MRVPSIIGLYRVYCIPCDSIGADIRCHDERDIGESWREDSPALLSAAQGGEEPWCMRQLLCGGDHSRAAEGVNNHIGTVSRWDHAGRREGPKGHWHLPDAAKRCLAALWRGRNLPWQSAGAAETCQGPSPVKGKTGAKRTHRELSV